MSQYIRAGGYSMWILIALSAVLLVTAILFFRKPTPERLAFLRALSLAQVLATVGGVATNFTTVFYTVAREHGRTGKLEVGWLFHGAGEALTPAGFGFSVLSVIWLIIAVGVRRAHDPS